MRSEWEDVKLKNIVDFNPRETLKKGILTKKIGMADIVEHQRKVPTCEIVRYTSGTRFKNEDTLFAKITPCLENGKIAQVDFLDDGEIGFGSTEFIVWRAKPNITDPDFVFYLANYQPIVDTAIKSMVGTSGRQRVQLDVLENYEFISPPLPTQKAIAATLSCLDAKIEVNNKIIKNLEQQAQAIFKSWFVDFEPFQDGEFVESELGLIPKGWSVGNLEGIAEITMGQSPKSSSYNKEGLGEVFYQGSSDFGWRFPARRRFTTDPKRMANKGDVLLSVRAPVGEINLAFEPCCIGRGLASIRNATCPSFLLYTLYAIQERLAQFNAEGTVFGSINQGALKTLQIITPPKNIMLRFDTIVKVNDQIIWTLSEQNTTLAALRDTLLPKLMSGEIEVPVEQD